MGPFMTKDEVCERLHIQPGTLRGIMERREISHYRIGGCVRFDEADVADYVRRNAVRAAPVIITPAPVAPVTRGKGRPPKMSGSANGYVPGMKVV
ncbi:MAG: hypothetical protein CVU91_10930 [Firmicutes bacterium HGW-Firmicutes-16]|nr:MAG: hypothetical protein CVU91_10930 [Firmicutes bacterium HGW-Firmicutes-16]